MAKKAPGAPAPEPVVQPEQEQAPAPEPVVPAADPPAVPPEPEPAQPPAAVEPLAAYAARIEEAAQPLPVCEITHPDAKDGGLHVGKYAGIRLKHGDKPAALLSDGSTL